MAGFAKTKNTSYSLWFSAGIFILSMIFTRFVFAGAPQEITYSNITANKLTISWLTEENETGYINYGITAALGNTVYDLRGSSYSGKNHYVDLAEDITSSTTIYYDIISGETTYDNNGSHYTVKTAPKLNPSLIYDIVHGQIFLPDGITPATGAIVFIKIRDNDGSGESGESALSSNLITNTSNGHWLQNLSNTRISSLDAFFTYSATGDNIIINVIGPNLETGSLIADTANDDPTDSIILTINTAPVLEWTGELNYIDKGLFPETGYSATDFTFRIKYKDADGNAPDEHKLYLDKNGDNDYSDAGEIINMQSAGDVDYVNGVIYTHTTKIPYSTNSTNYSYYFSFSDGKEYASGTITAAINAATAINKPDISPTLSINIDKTIWPLPQISAGSEHITDASQKVKVTHTGDGAQTYTLQITGEGQWFAASGKDGAGVNTFVLSGIFAETSKTDIDAAYFNELTSDDVITTAGVKATAANFGSNKTSKNGALVFPNEERNLWFEFKAPRTDTKGETQSIKVTVSAGIP